MSTNEIALTALHLTTTWNDPTTATVAVAGEIDLATARHLTTTLTSILAGGHAQQLIVDLAEVRFLGC